MISLLLSLHVAILYQLVRVRCVICDKFTAITTCSDLVSAGKG